MCIRIGTKIELSDELKNVGEYYSKKISDTWDLIMSAHAMIKQDGNIFWGIICKEHPELNDYELSYDEGKILILRDKTRI